MEELEIIKASEVETREIEWLWYGADRYHRRAAVGQRTCGRSAPQIAASAVS